MNAVILYMKKNLQFERYRLYIYRFTPFFAVFCHGLFMLLYAGIYILSCYG